ncbi:MAG TPA: type II secretion system protein [Dokdonella sp.]
MKRNLPTVRRARGFTLIELIAAFLVFAIAIGLLMQVLSSAMRQVRQSSDYTMAALWAQSKLDAVGVGERIEAGRTNGRFDDTYSWDLHVQQVDPSAVEPPPQLGATVSAADAGLGEGIEIAPFDLYQVDLVVSWESGNGRPPRTAHFGTLRAVNPDAEQGNGAQPGMPGSRGQRTGSQRAARGGG